MKRALQLSPRISGIVATGSSLLQAFSAFDTFFFLRVYIIFQTMIGLLRTLKEERLEFQGETRS